MTIDMLEEYYHTKKSLLRQCINISEEFLNSLENWELFPNIMSRREEVIQKLKQLEITTGKTAAAYLPPEKKRELDNLFGLILELDKDCACQIYTEQQNILCSLKRNIKEQKLMQYAQVNQPEQGKVFDYKK